MPRSGEPEKLVGQVVTVLTPEVPRYPVERLSAWFDPLPPLYAFGSLDLLWLELTGLFCSRKCPGDAILRAYDLARDLRECETPVIGGFHTPVEKDVLEILLKGKGPVVVCPARGIENPRLSLGDRRRVEQGTLLILSCFPPEEKRATEENALVRNRLVLGLSARVRVLYASPSGNIARLVEESGVEVLI